MGGEAEHPYAGWKESGLGFELSEHALDEYSLVKHIRMRWGKAMGGIFSVDLASGVITGARRWERRLSDMADAFFSQDAVEKLLRVENPLIYEVYEVSGVPEKTGELIWSTTVLYPGVIGKEFFMTKGHYHRDPGCAEVYFVFSGNGYLLLRDKDSLKALPVVRGSLAHIPPGCAHRMVNTGDVPLVFFAVFPAQAGHDYERIKREGFGLRVVKGEKGPEVLYMA